MAHGGRGEAPSLSRKRVIASFHPLPPWEQGQWTSRAQRGPLGSHTLQKFHLEPCGLMLPNTPTEIFLRLHNVLHGPTPQPLGGLGGWGWGFWMGGWEDLLCHCITFWLTKSTKFYCLRQGTIKRGINFSKNFEVPLANPNDNFRGAYG